MKKVLLIAAAVVTTGLIFAFMPKNDSVPAASKEDGIKWYTWDEAIKANAANKKIIFIDFYTDWCGWCKRMDATTFTDPAVVKYMNENFYAVKFNAEQKEEVVFDGQTFKWQAGGRGGIHTLAYSLLDGKLGYPSYVYLSPAYERILISPGYKPAEDLNKELKFVKEGHYNNTTWEEYKVRN